MGLTGCSLPLSQVGVHLRERIPVHGHGGELRLQQNERRGLHQRQRKREGLGRRRLCLPLPGWLVSRSDGRSQLGSLCEAGTLNGFVTRPLIGQRFACRLLRVTVTAVDGTAVNLGQTKRQRNHESNCPRE